MGFLDQFMGFGAQSPQSLEDLFPTTPELDKRNKGAVAASIAFSKRKPVDQQLPDWGPDGTQVTTPIDKVGLLNSGNVAGMFGQTPRQLPALSADMGDPSGAGMPPSTNDPLSGEPQVFKDGVPLPKPKPIIPGDPTTNVPDRAPTDVSSANAPAPLSLAPGGQQQQGQAGGGIGGLLGNLLKSENAPLLLSLAGGFAGAPSIGTGMRRAFSGATPAAMQLQQSQLKMSSQGATFKALIEKGVPPAEAMAATLNPDVMKATAAKYFETKPRVPHKIGVDMMGNDIMGSFDPNTNKYYDAAGRAIGASGAGGATAVDSGAGMLAKGVSEMNQDLPADEFKAQFSPQVQAQMDSYIRGDTMPTGNPRVKGSATKIKEWATLYGSKAGIPVSDATFSERRKYRTELGTNSPNSAGGQAKAFNQGIEHATSLADKIEKLGNYDPLGIPLVAHGINAAREALSTTQKSKANEVNAIGQTLAGEVGKLFSGAAGGGVHERELTRQRFNSVTSNKELAGALEATLETMEGGLHALEQRRDQVLGANSGVELVNAETRKKIDKIREVVARLKSGEAAPAAPPAGKTGTGVNWKIVQ